MKRTTLPSIKGGQFHPLLISYILNKKYKVYRVFTKTMKHR